MAGKEEKATFAGGCFWCMVQPFDERPGIISVVSGYTGGTTPNPTYEQVCSNTTGHVEAVQITYDPTIVDYDDLVTLYWQQIDPTDPGGQFYNQGSSYKTAIFYHNEAQHEVAQKSKEALENSGRFNKPIATKILEAKPFYDAEEYHQDFYKKNPTHYKNFRQESGRQAFIDEYWKAKDNDKEDLKAKLSEMQYHVTQEDGTEPPFHNEYWDEFAEGIYVDIISGEVLFSSKDKYDAQCGWPSFTKPINDQEITEHEDLSKGMVRTEVRSKTGSAHLGHVFTDGPQEYGGLRYCINSAALRFIEKEKMEEEGYGKYLTLFQD